MDKKNYIWLVVGVVVVVAVIYLLVSGSSTSQVGEKPKAGNPGSAVPALNGTPAAGSNTPIAVQDTTPPKENIIAVEGNSFSPKNIEVISGSKVFLTLSARDAKKHTLAFEDDDLSYITVSFNKEEGDKSITFVAPKAGTYSFYVDSKDNKGSLTVK